jgi:hypothetical protein
MAERKIPPPYTKPLLGVEIAKVQAVAELGLLSDVKGQELRSMEGQGWSLTHYILLGLVVGYLFNKFLR